MFQWYFELWCWVVSTWKFSRMLTGLLQLLTLGVLLHFSGLPVYSPHTSKVLNSPKIKQLKQRFSTLWQTQKNTIKTWILDKLWFLFFSHKQSLFTKRNIKNKIVPIYCMTCWHVWTTCKNNNNKNIDNNHCTKNMMGKIWGQTSQNKKKHLY